MLVCFVKGDSEEVYSSVSQGKTIITGCQPGLILSASSNKVIKNSESLIFLIGPAETGLWGALSTVPQTKKATLNPWTIWTMENPAFQSSTGVLWVLCGAMLNAGAMG